MAADVAKLETLSAWMQPRARTLIHVLELLGFKVRVYSARRTLEEQQELKAKGWTTTLKSKHLDGDAMDLIIDPAYGYRFAGLVWTSFGGLWGGNFKDPARAKVEFQHYEKLS